MDNIRKSNVLVVGAGGIGCELLKNLVMWNFPKIMVIDLDTIDVSNLNRQFLFRKENVGKSKALVAKESVLRFNPNVSIESRHDDIMSEKYNVQFFKSFDIVLNALDNKTARNHVNRMCVNAGVPLIEGGTMGYRGQVQVIMKGKTACYECYPKPAQKQYPACTIRNTPSEPIHCVIWAKFLFNQLFGEPDADQDVVPDQNDPELINENGVVENGDKASPLPKINIRSVWKVLNKYEPSLLLKVLFCQAITELLLMKVLWTKTDRVKPELLAQDCIDADVNDISHLMSVVTGGVKDQEKLSLYNWCQIFKKSAMELVVRMDKSGGILNWDKDDVVAMDFVAAAANIRMNVFHILPLLTRFEMKSMAGNIIPAIATTNAMIAGISVLHAYKILNGESDKCKDVMVSEFVSARGKIVQAVEPLSPVIGCYVCSDKRTLVLRYKTPSSVSLKVLKTDILKRQLKMMAPNVAIQNKSNIIIDGEDEDEDEDSDNEYLSKTLDQFDMTDCTVLRCSDFNQMYEFNIELKLSPEMTEDYELVGDISGVIATAVPESAEEPATSSSINESTILLEATPMKANDRKRKHEESIDEVLGKAPKIDYEVINEDDNDDLIIIDC